VTNRYSGIFGSLFSSLLVFVMMALAEGIKAGLVATIGINIFGVILVGLLSMGEEPEYAHQINEYKNNLEFKAGTFFASVVTIGVGILFLIVLN